MQLVVSKSIGRVIVQNSAESLVDAVRFMMHNNSFKNVVKKSELNRFICRAKQRDVLISQTTVLNFSFNLQDSMSGKYYTRLGFQHVFFRIIVFLFLTKKKTVFVLYCFFPGKLPLQKKTLSF